MPAHAGAHFERGAGPDPHRPDHDFAIGEFAEAEHRILAHRHVVAEVEQIPAAAAQVDAAVQMDALADPRAERAQGHQLQFRALQQLPRHEPHEAQHAPVAQVPEAVDRRPAGAVATDQQPLAEHGEPERARHPQQPAAEPQERQRRGEQQRIEPALCEQPRQRLEPGEVREARADPEFAE